MLSLQIRKELLAAEAEACVRKVDLDRVERGYRLGPAAAEAEAAYAAAVAFAKGKRGALDLRRKALYEKEEAFRQDPTVKAATSAYKKACAALQEAERAFKAAWDSTSIVRGTVAPIIRRHLRTNNLKVDIGASPGASVTREKTRSKYSKGWHNSFGPAVEATTEVSVRPDYLERVHAAGLEALDGIVTLDAEPIDAPAGYSAWNAVWLKQKKGYDLDVVKGVIVREDGAQPRYSHVRAVKDGVALLKRRAKLAALEAQTQQADLLQYPHVHVTMKDARKAGLCDPGIQAWCARAGITPEDGATVGQVLDALKKGAGQQTLAESACRQAIRQALKGKRMEEA